MLPIYRPEVSDGSAEDIAQAIEIEEHLNDLQIAEEDNPMLPIYRPEVSDGSAEDIAQAIEIEEHLNDLQIAEEDNPMLPIYRPEVSDGSAEDIAQAIEVEEHLKDLQIAEEDNPMLPIYRPEVSDGSAEDIAQAIEVEEHLKDLQIAEEDNPMLPIYRPEVSDGSAEDIAQAIEVEEHLKDLQIAEEDNPMLPIYRPEGVWLDRRGGAREYALSWAYEHYGRSSENTRKFMVNAVAAIFDYDLLQFCSEMCADEGPCLNCGNWKWTKGQMPEVEKPEIAKLVTCDGMRCAVSMIVTTKADLWRSGSTFFEEETEDDDGTSVKVKVLQKHSKRMLEDLFPNWSMADAIEPVVTAGMWASTRFIFKLVGGAAVPDCVPVWDDEDMESKIYCGSELKKAFLLFPAGTEELVESYRATQELLKSPMALYFPNVPDLEVILEEINKVKENPISYHVAAKSFGVEPLEQINFRSVRGRLGAFKSAQIRASGMEATSAWQAVEAENDYDRDFADRVEAYFGLKPTYQETACILLKALPRITVQNLSHVLDEFEITLSCEQSAIFEALTE